MSRQEIVEQVEGLAQPIAGRRGLEVADVELLGEGPRTILRVALDGPQGVTVEDCAKVSEALSRRLDVRDLIPHAYTLEVASPGLDRPLKKPRDFERFAGRQAEVRTFGPIEGRRRFTGRLMGVVEEQVVLYADGRTVRLPWSQVASARLVVDEAALRQDLSGGGQEER